MAIKKAELIVSLIDRLSGPARGIGGALDRLTAAQNRNNQRLDVMRGRMVEAGAVAYALARSLSAPIRAATEFETVLEDAAQKIDLPADKLQELGSDIRQVARDTTQSARQMAEAFDILAGKGANQSDALAMLEPIGKAATAYRADINDLANASYAALDNLKIPADQLGQALDIMAQAGKAGSFEISDLSKYLPQLGAAYQGLGQTGVGALADIAAAAQVVRTGTGDSASAATNLNNILQKINAPQTAKAFKKLGVNLEKELARAAEHGLTPLEAIAEITNQTLKGDLSKLGYLFADAQVQQGLRPLLQNMELYREIRAEALNAQGTVSADYQRRLQTGAIAGQRFANAMENVNTSIGAALLPAMAQLGETLVPIIDRMATFAENNPKLTQTVVGLASGLIGLRVAGLAARFGLLWMKGGFISAAIGGLKGLQGAVSGASAALRGMKGLGSAFSFGGIANGLGFTSSLSMFSATLAALPGIAMTALSGVGAAIAGISAPIWLAVGAVVGLGFVFYKYWTPISEFVAGFAGVIYDALSDVVADIAAFGGRVAAAVGGWAKNKLLDFAEWLGFDREQVGAQIDAVVADVMAAGGRVVEHIKSIPAMVGNWLGDLFTMNEYTDVEAAKFRASGMAWGRMLVDGVADTFSTIGSKISTLGSQMLDVGTQMAQSLWDGVSRKIDEMIAWFTDLPGRIIRAIGSIDIGSLISWPKMPSWLGGSAGSGTEIPGRATGGPVAAGMPYMVGERGPELIIPRHNGYVVPNHVLGRGSAGSGTGDQAAGKGVSVTNNITVYSQVNETADALARRIAGSVKDTVEGSFMDAGFA